MFRIHQQKMKNRTFYMLFYLIPDLLTKIRYYIKTFPYIFQLFLTQFESILKQIV